MGILLKGIEAFDTLESCKAMRRNRNETLVLKTIFRLEETEEIATYIETF